MTEQITETVQTYLFLKNIEHDIDEKALSSIFESLSLKTQCKSLTSKHDRCKNRSLPNSFFCSKHILSENFNTPCQHIITRGQRKDEMCNKKCNFGMKYCGLHSKIKK
jgi:hypothetical protein